VGVQKDITGNLICVDCVSVNSLLRVKFRALSKHHGKEKDEIMSFTDPIGDMLTRMRNAIMVKKKEVSIPSSGMKVEIAKVLKEEGYIQNFKVVDDNKQGTLNISLKYTDDNQSVITGLRRISKPGCRIYCKTEFIPKVLHGLGVVIISTSKGITTGKKCEEIGVGGEVLCYIW
jgi:small subunit ribosomal protein S8